MTTTFLLARRPRSHFALLLALAGLLYFGGCRERGSDLTHEEGPTERDSAAVANQATAPANRAAAPGTSAGGETSDANAAAGAGGAASPGVERGYADASGGHSLPRKATGGETTNQERDTPSSSAEASGLEQRVREELQRVAAGSAGAREREITVRVEQGRVVLEGSVENREVARELGEKAKAVPGVEAVDNRLQAPEQQPAE